MQIDYDNNNLIKWMSKLFVFIGALGGCDLFFSFCVFCKSIEFIVVSSSIICLIIGIILYKCSEYSRKFDDVGVHFMKRKKVYKSIFWNDFITAYLVYDRFNRQIIIYLSSVTMDSFNCKKLSVREINELGVYPLYFSVFEKESEKYKDIISFIEEKYEVKFD